MKKVTTTHLPTVKDLLHLAVRSDISSIGAIVNKVMGIIRSPNSNANELRLMIDIDPPLSAKVLMRANSAYYGVARDISSIHEAIVLIGFNTVREIVMNLKVAKLFEGKSEDCSFSRTMLWKHSVAVAMCCKYLYRREFKELGDDIYSAALLHDIGVILEDQFAHKHFAKAIGFLAKGEKKLVDAEMEVFGFDHAELGASLVSSWRMPAELTEAIASHHKPLECNPMWQRASASIFVSDFACRDAGLSIDLKGDDAERAYFLRSLDALKISVDSIELIVEDVSKEIEEMEKRGELFS